MPNRLADKRAREGERERHTESARIRNSVFSTKRAAAASIQRSGARAGESESERCKRATKQLCCFVVLA